MKDSRDVCARLWRLAAAHLLLVSAATAIIGALVRGARVSDSLEGVKTEGDSLMQGIWVCTNVVLATSINRKTLAALRHAPLAQDGAEGQPTSKMVLPVFPARLPIPPSRLCCCFWA